ncbi:hypothetical protein [Arthrobacter sp. efr-133-TYG-104]|uniref:hypothetical protein n=1 Tax=Arthrobacter sp. efr-133-TYG-104 TaxID=3040324 RepID=UPI00254D9668|nr:hypothetical protein [Arthrobacter sp. efr-133-TYG-104]
MLSLVIVVLATIAAGFIVWGADKRHSRYGTVLPAGIATTVGALAWIIFISVGWGYQPGLTWIPWVGPIVLGTIAAVAVAIFLGRTRTKLDTAALTRALRL